MKIHFNDENVIEHFEYEKLEVKPYYLFCSKSGIYPFVKFEENIKN